MPAFTLFAANPLPTAKSKSTSLALLASAGRTGTSFAFRKQNPFSEASISGRSLVAYFGLPLLPADMRLGATSRQTTRYVARALTFMLGTFSYLVM
jgi:hypothetical protein